MDINNRTANSSTADGRVSIQDIYCYKRPPLVSLEKSNIFKRLMSSSKLIPSSSSQQSPEKQQGGMKVPFFKSRLFHVNKAQPLETGSSSDPVKAQLDQWVNQAATPKEMKERQKIANAMLPQTQIENGRLCFQGDLVLEKLKFTTSFPDGLIVNGNMNLWLCEKITSLPGNLEVRGDLEVLSCHALLCLPENLKVQGLCEVFRCERFEEVKPGISVGLGLDIRESPAFSILPQTLKINGNLSLLECPSIEKLSEFLQVDGSFNMLNCKAIESLSENLSVQGDFKIIGCGIKSLLSLNVHGAITIGSCFDLVEFPQNFHIIGPCESGGKRLVTLFNCPQLESSDTVRENKIPGVKFEVTPF